MRDLVRERTGAELGSAFGEVFKINPKISDLPETMSVKLKDDDSLKLLVMGTVDKGGGKDAYVPLQCSLKPLSGI